MFPPEVYVDGETHVIVREEASEHCDGLDVGERRVVGHLEAFLPELLRDLDDPTTEVEL